MKQGYLKIKQNEANQLIIEANIENDTLWMTKHEIAYLFNVVVNSVGNTIRSIFKSGILREENVTQIHKFTLNGRTNEVVLYNLEAIIHIGFRVASSETQAFRKWITECFIKYLIIDELKSSKIHNTLNCDTKFPFTFSLN